MNYMFIDIENAFNNFLKLTIKINYNQNKDIGILVLV